MNSRAFSPGMKGEGGISTQEGYTIRVIRYWLVKGEASYVSFFPFIFFLPISFAHHKFHTHLDHLNKQENFHQNGSRTT